MNWLPRVPPLKDWLCVRVRSDVGYNQSLARLTTPSGPALNLLFISLPAWSPSWFPATCELDSWDATNPPREGDCSPMLSKFSYVGWFIFLTNFGLLMMMRRNFIEPPRPGVGVIPGRKPQLPSWRWILMHLKRTRAW